MSKIIYLYIKNKLKIKSKHNHLMDERLYIAR